MRGVKLWLVLCALYSSTLTQEEGEGDADHGFVENLQAAFNASGVGWDEIVAYPELETYGMEFECPLESSRSPATTVHELTAYDIKVVAAMGDSVTAGFGAGAKTIFKAFTEYRGVSWSIGGDEDLASLTTLPNIVKKYNPNVKGFSVKTGKETSSNANLNVAITGAIARDVPEQAKELVDKIKADSSVDFDNDWKLVTIWIGGNDLCRACKGSSDHTPENYVGYIRETLEYLRAEMPRTFVNVVKAADVTQIAAVGGILCNIVHLYTCSCAKNAKEETSAAYQTYNSLLEEMVQYFQDDSDDFAVVLQPFMQGVQLPQDDVGSFFAPDCFHFSIKSHEIAATALWNNMNEPLGMKDDDLDLENGEQFKCPHEDFPFFFTHKNSQQAYGIESDNSTTENDGSSHILAILIGAGVGVYLVAMVTTFTTIGVVRACRRRRKRRSKHYIPEDSERIVLVRT